MTLRASLHADIVRRLGAGGFLSTDFRLETEIFNRGTKLRLTYEYADAFFAATIPDHMSSRLEDDSVIKRKVFYHDIRINVRPGRLNIEESQSATDDDSLLSAIADWLERIQADLKHTPIARSVQDHEQLIRDLYEKIGLTDEADGPLESQQAKSIVDWIKDLETKMSENLRKSEKDKAAFEKKLAALHSQIEVLCNIVNSHITKRGVVRAIMGRVLNWTSKPGNQQLLKDAGATVVGLLSHGEKK